MKGLKRHGLFLIYMCIIISLCGCSSSSASDRKVKCEKILESKYGKDFTVSKIYGGDYSGVYYGEAYPNDNPNLVFSFRNNMNSESTESWSDEYIQRLKVEDYREDFNEKLDKYGKDYYVKITVYNNKDLGINENYKEFDILFCIYVSSSWLDFTNDELWEIFSQIAEEYQNYHLCFVNEEDLRSIKEEMESSDDLSHALKSKLEEKYSHTYNHGEGKQGAVIVTKDDKAKFISKMEEIRKNEELSE